MNVNQNQGLDPQQTFFFDDNNDTFGIHDYESKESLLTLQSSIEPIRIEAESLDLHTYRVVDNRSGSGGKIITLLGGSALETGTASYVFAGEQGDYDIILGYYDENDGQARLQIEKNDTLLDDWRLDRDLPSNVGDRQTLTTRKVGANIALQPGDRFKITGTETELEHARVDYLEFRPISIVTPDRTSPLIEAELANDTGMSATDGITFEPTVTGRIDDDGAISSFKAKFSSNEHFIDVTAQVHADGSFNFDRHQLQVINNGHPLADGHYTLELLATDQAGNTSELTPVSFILDTTPPGIHLTGLAEGSTISSSSLLSGSVTEEMVMLTYRFNNGQEIEVGIGDRFFAQKFNLAGLDEGRNHLTLTATDKAGNVHTRTKTVHVDLLQDNEPPSLIAVLTRDTGRVMPKDTITSEVLIVGFVNDSSGVSSFQGSLVGNDLQLDLKDIIGERGRFKIDAEKLAEINGGVPLEDGSYVLNLTASDREGNVTDIVPVSLILDTTNPLITAGLANDTGINSKDNLTNDPTIEGNVRDLNGFDSILVGFSTTPRSELVDIKEQVQANGNFVLSAAQLAEINDKTSLADGDYILHILATDIAGNSAKTLDIAFRLDTTAPELQVTTPLNNGTITTNSQLVGRVNEAASLTYRLNNGSEIPLILNRDRQFAQTIIAAPGQQTLTITATDKAGNVTTEVINLKVVEPKPTDTTPPVINASLVIDSGIDNSDRLTNEAAVVGTVIDQSEIASFKAGLNNNDAGLLELTDLLQSDGNFILEQTTLGKLNKDLPLADGDYTLNLMATDAAGNEAESSLSFTLDTTPPTINLTQPLNNSAIADDSQLVGTVDEDLVLLTYRFNDGVEVDVALENRNFSQSLDTVGLPTGDNSLILTAIDQAGNVREQVITVTISEADTVAPVITAALVTDSGINNGDRITNSPQITGMVNDDREVTAVVAGLGNTNLDITELIQSDGSFVLDQATLIKLNNDLPLADGDYTLNLIATDAAGNEAEFPFSFTLDTTPPVVDLVTPAANSQVIATTQLTGTVNEETTRLTYSLGDGAEISLNLDQAREFQQTLDLEGVPSGQQIITFTATDIAGNTSTSTVEIEVVADDGNIPVVNADLANDTGNSKSDRLTLDPTVTGQITSTQQIATLVGSLNGADFVDISTALNADNTFTLGLAELELLSNSNLPDGDYQIDLKATNTLGRESEIFPVTFTLDRTEPPIDFDLAPDSDTGELGDGITTERVVTLIGQTEPGLTVVLTETQQQTIADDQGNFSFTDVALPSAGTAAFTVVTQDAAGNQGRSTKNLTREGLNDAPTITSTPETNVDTAQSNIYTYQVTAIDPDQDAISYTLLNAPIGAEIDAQGLLTFELSETPSPTYEFTVEASDGRGGIDTQTFTVATSDIFTGDGVIEGFKWNDLNGNGVRDTELVQGANPDVIFTLDVSGSADFEFVGSSIGDLNGDGLVDTILDAEIAGFISLNQQLVDQGFGERARVSIVVFSGRTANADMNLALDGLQLTTTPSTDSDGDGITDVEEILRSIRSGAFGVGNFTGTNPEAALQKVEETFDAIGTESGNGNLIFLTDGEQNRGASINNEVESLREQGFNLSAFGVGDNASLNIVQTIDPDGIKFTSTDELLNVFNNLDEGSQGALEPGLAGVSIYLDTNNNGVLDAGEPVQITAEDNPDTPDLNEAGEYRFTNLAPDTYIVREVVPENFEQTFPLRNAASAGDGNADVILEYFAAGNAPSPLVEPYGSNGGIPAPSAENSFGFYTVESVEPEIVLGAPPPSPVIGSNPEVNWLALPQGSFVTVGFTDEVIVDGAGDDIFIRSFDPQDSANENADVFVSSNGTDFEFLGRVNEQGLVALDLADIGFDQPVTAVRVQGVDNLGSSPGFDLIGVEVLPNSGASPDFYTVDLAAGETITEIDFGNVQSNRDPVITSVPVLEAAQGQPYEYLVRANDPDGDVPNFSLNEAPDGMTINSDTGLISYTPPIVETAFNFDTSESQVRPNIDNQLSFTDDAQGFNFRDQSRSSDYAIGESFNSFTNLPAGPIFRSVVSFDLGSLNSPVTSAKLQLQQYSTSGDAVETLGLFDVDTDIDILYSSSVESPAIFQDLGTGNSYGSFDVATGASSTEIVEFELNSAAITDINAAAGSFFSIGLDLLSINPNNQSESAEYLFANSSSQGTQRLVLETENQETVEILVNDGRGGEARQNYTLTIVENSDNQSPSIISSPDTNSATGETYTYEIEAIDPNADPLTYNLVDFPEGMTITEEGVINWNPTEVGIFNVEIEVSDGRGGLVTQSYPITVTSIDVEDTEAPTVNLGFNSSVLEVGASLNLQIQGFDNVGLADLDLTLDGTPLTLTPDVVSNGLINNATFITNQPGVFEVVATATDTAGNTDTKTQTIRFIDPNDNEAPVIELDTSIIDPFDQVIRTPSNLVGTVTDDNLEFYRVEIAPVSLIDFDNPAAADSDYTILAEGNSNQVNTSLAQIDPSLFRNDNYFVRVIAQDFSGNLSAEGLVFGIDTPNKPGEFAQEFTDLSIPLTGVPIEITRRYSSLDANFQGDFGFGWSLGVQDAQIVESTINPSENELFGFLTATPFDLSSRVTLTNPDGERVGFTFDPIPVGLPFVGTGFIPRFRPDPGVEETLSFPGAATNISGFGIPNGAYVTQRSDGTFGQAFPFNFIPFNPDRYVLTTKDGTAYNYDQFDGLESIEDRNGNTLTYSDDGIISSTGASVEFIRDNQGRITEIIDPQGQSIEYTYNAAGDLVNVTDRATNQTTLKYENERSHYLTEIIDPLGRSGVKTEYGADGRISRFIDADGNALDLDFGAAADFQSIADPLGNITTLFYDERGNVVRQVDALGGETVTTYDDDNNVLTRTDAEGNTTSFTYDDSGNVLTETDALGNTTTFTYNQFAQVLTTTNALGDVATNNYDADGNLLITTDAEGNTTAYEYDLQGNLTQQIDANGNIADYGYNALGLLTNITQNLDGQDLVSTLGYDNNGNLTSITTPAGRTTVFSYDNENRLITATDALGNISRIEYDAAGQRTATIDALGRRTEFAYNSRGLLTQTTFPDGTVEINEYDILDRLVATTDPNGNKTQFQYNALDELTGVINAVNNQTIYGRDLVGNLISQTDANGNTTAFTYDALNRLVTTELPLGQTLTNDYDAVGNLISINDFNGDILNYDYDALGQLTQVITADNTVLEAFTYSPTGQIATVTDERGLTIFEYDDLDRLVKRTDPDNTFISYLYDGDDNIISLTTPGGTVGYTYDAVGFLDTVTDRDGAITDYDYDAVGNLIQTSFANGVVETRDYDSNNRVEEIITTNANGDILASYEYTFDNLGNRLTETDNTGRVTSYNYNQINQVTGVNVSDAALGNTTTNYEYDAAGNVVKKTDSSGETNYTYDENDRLIEESSNGQVITYSYDAAGNLIDKAINGIIVEVYNWNLQGELASAAITDGAVTTNTEYEYDANGIRVSQTVDGNKTNFLIDNLQQEFAQVIEEYNANSTNVIYTHGLDLISQTRDNAQGYYHTDSLGSTRLLTNDAGNIINTYLYDAYGKIIQQSEILENSYKFTGEQLDPNLESYYLRARYYNPATGRFNSRDSFAGFLERPLSLNDYLYGEGNPINAIDPSGNVAIISYLKISTSNKTNQFAFALIGGLQGFGAPSLFFVGNVLSEATSVNRADNFLEIAFMKTIQDVDSLIDTLTRIRALDVGNLVKSFVGGAGIDISLNLKEPVKRTIFAAGGKPPSRDIIKLGGFKNGAASGLEYIRSKIGLS